RTARSTLCPTRRSSDLIEYTGNSFRRRIGMDRRKHEMSRHGSFHRHIDSLLITDLSHHDDVRVLTQRRSQTLGKRITDVRSDLRSEEHTSELQSREYLV